MSKNLYNVWTDGSYRNKKAGGGWIISGGGEVHEGSSSLSELEDGDLPHGSDISEVLAVVGALREVPQKSNVSLRLDCQNVCDWLSKGKITTASKHSAPTLTQLFDEAVVLIGGLGSFSVERVSGKQNEKLNRVHTLSQIASSHGR